MPQVPLHEEEASGGKQVAQSPSPIAGRWKLAACLPFDETTLA